MSKILKEHKIKKIELPKRSPQTLIDEIAKFYPNWINTVDKATKQIAIAYREAQKRSFLEGTPYIIQIKRKTGEVIIKPYEAPKQKEILSSYILFDEMGDK